MEHPTGSGTRDLASLREARASALFKAATPDGVWMRHRGPFFTQRAGFSLGLCISPAVSISVFRLLCLMHLRGLGLLSGRSLLFRAFSFHTEKGCNGKVVLILRLLNAA